MNPKEILAHSAQPDNNIQAQTYAEHVANVERQACRNAAAAGAYLRGGNDRIVQVAGLAALFHDLGKLDEANQAALRETGSRRKLPIKHEDAGAAALLDKRRANASSALLVKAHHAGLPDIPDELASSHSFSRDRERTIDGKPLSEYTDENLSLYLETHESVMKAIDSATSRGDASLLLEKNALLFRIALSCLVDADHYDTARHYNDTLPAGGLPLRPWERLRRLDAYVDTLSQGPQHNRTLLRKQVYQACRNGCVETNMYSCDSPVGTGKTTAVMAHLLKASAEKQLRRVFVVLPFTNIIDQSVDVYRAALVDSGEDACEVVAAHHHRAEFDSPQLRQYSFLWHAPVVVTTAVQFFETLATNHPASLRKLHQLPGSAIFIDEAHAALPAHLWPQAWKWLKDLRDNWGCHIVLGSGTLSKFWQLAEFEESKMELPELIPEDVRTATLRYEKHRTVFSSHPEPLNLSTLLDFLQKLPGPRLLIVNTVQTAAVIANKLKATRSRAFVEHLSTALCPADRKKALDVVLERLKDHSDTEWTLVATSCVEAGVNLSFRTGLRERSSLNSLIQTGGRVNRQGEFQHAELWDIELRLSDGITSNRAFDTPRRVLSELITENHVTPEYATEAMRREIRQKGLASVSRQILECERNLKFPDVAEQFKVIESNTITAVVDEVLKNRLRKREKISASEIVLGSVQMWANRGVKYGVQDFEGYPGLYSWQLGYDGFLGYMSGVVEILKMGEDGSVFG